ncbi:metacaspase [Klebsormidium nitens]|uniref:Metacaspase n=1 Tax=Klebsormidium nitens TaxID=105231 RepID=A0A1Y1HRF2_KLENI|nr:metacaspase [Klebsormidium nitens]|eukprot:GAQ79571.1 metacaspase [Klebsormidium nitens]
MPGLISARSIGSRDLAASVNGTDGLGEGLDKLGAKYRGRRRALLVAVNYVQSDRGVPRLYGCTKDVELARELLTSVYGFEESDIMVLADAGPFSRPHALPTKTNIVQYLNQLVEESEEGDTAYFHYSGHGAQAPDSTGKEWDGLMEVLCPSDMTVSGPDGFDNYIGQEEFKDLILNFRRGVWGVVVLDCCHSGDDSPGSGSGHRGLPEESEDSPPFRNRKINFMSPSEQGGLTRGPDAPFGSNSQSAGLLDAPGDVAEIPVMWSACGESQTSADANINGGPVGAFSHFFYGTLLAAGGDTARLSDVMNAVKGGLKKGRFTQRPIFKLKHGSGREVLPLVPPPGGSFTRRALPRVLSTANPSTVTSRRDDSPLGEVDTTAVVRKLEAQSGLAPEDLQVLENPPNGKRREPILEWKTGVAPPGASGEKDAPPGAALDWDASQIYARALAAGGFKGLRAAAQLAGDAALLEILSRGAFRRLSTDTVRDPASADFTPRGVPVDLLETPPGDGMAAERVSAYLQRVLAAVPGASGSLDQARAVLWEELRRLGGEACVAAGTPALDTPAKDSPDINSTYAAIYSLIAPLNNPMLVRSALGVVTGLAYDLDFWDAYDAATAGRPPPADVPAEIRPVGSANDGRGDGTAAGSPTGFANGSVDGNALATRMTAGRKITNPPPFLAWDEELGAKVAAYNDFVAKYAGEIDEDAARRSLVASLIAEKGGAGLWFGEIMGRTAVPPWEPSTGTDQMRTLGSNVGTPVVGLVGEHPREKQLLGTMLALTGSIQGVQVGLDIAHAARLGSLTEPDRQRHFGSLLALCRPEASSRELLSATWQLIGLEVFLRTPGGASGSSPHRWNGDTVAGLVAYVSAASGNSDAGDAASELVRATIRRDEEDESALAADLYGLAGPLGWEVLRGRAREFAVDGRVTPEEASLLLDDQALLGFCQVAREQLDAVTKSLVEAAKGLKGLSDDDTASVDGFENTKGITVALRSCEHVMKTFKSWDACKKALLGGAKEKDTGKLMDMLIAYRNYEWRKIWYTMVLPTVRRFYGEDPGFMDPDIDEPSGSTVRTSDIDVPVWKGSRAGEAVKVFNHEFRLRWDGAESGIVFDVNLYGPGFLRSFKEVEGTHQLVLVGHVSRVSQPYGGVQHPAARRWDVSSQMGWALARLVLNSRDMEFLAFRAAVQVYARAFELLVPAVLELEPFNTGDILTSVAPKRAADFLAACGAGSGDVYRRGGRPVDLLEEAVPAEQAAEPKAWLMGRTNRIYEQTLLRVDRRLRAFEKVKNYTPPLRSADELAAITGMVEDNFDDVAVPFREWRDGSRFEPIEPLKFEEIGAAGPEGFQLAMDYVTTSFRDTICWSNMFSNEAYYTEAAVQHAVDIQNAKKKHPGTRPPNLSPAEWGVCVQENIASFLEHSYDPQADPGKALLKNGKYLHRALDALRVTLETPNRPYARRLRAAAACVNPYFETGDALLRRLQRLAEKFMLMKNGSEADVYDDVRNTLLEWWRTDGEPGDGGREKMLRLWFDSGRRREDGCLVYTVLFDPIRGGLPNYARAWLENLLKPGGREQQRKTALAETRELVRRLGAFLYVYYSMAVWPLPESLDRSVRSRGLEGTARLMSDLDKWQVRDTVWIVTALDPVEAVTPVPGQGAAPSLAKQGSKNEWKVLFARGGRVRFCSSDGRFLGRSDKALEPALLNVTPADQQATDVIKNIDWQLVSVPGAVTEVLIKVPETETYLYYSWISKPFEGQGPVRTLTLRIIAVPGKKQAPEAAVVAAAPLFDFPGLKAAEAALTAATAERDRVANARETLSPGAPSGVRDAMTQDLVKAKEQVQQATDALAAARDAAAATTALATANAKAFEAARARKRNLDREARQPEEAPPALPGSSFRFLYGGASARYITALEVQALAIVGGAH